MPSVVVRAFREEVVAMAHLYGLIDNSGNRELIEALNEYLRAHEIANDLFELAEYDPELEADPDV